MAKNGFTQNVTNEEQDNYSECLKLVPMPAHHKNRCYEANKMATYCSLKFKKCQFGFRSTSWTKYLGQMLDFR